MPYSIHREPHSAVAGLLRVGSRFLTWIHRRTVRGAERVAARWRRVWAPFPWSSRFGILFIVCAVLGVALSRHGPAWFGAWLQLTDSQAAVLRDRGVLLELECFAILAGILGWFMGVASLIAFVRRRHVLVVLRTAAALFSLFWLWALSLIVGAPGLLYATDAKLLAKIDRNTLWFQGVPVWLLIWGMLLTGLLCVSLRSVRLFYSRGAAPVCLGDRILDDLRRHGGDRRFRTSVYWAGFLHLLILVLIPLIAGRGGCRMAGYALPKGEGAEIVQVVKIKRIKKKKEDKFVLNMNSPILFYRPELDDKILEELQEETLDTYVASSLQTGQLGKGKGGRGGWPQGMENAQVRFIRLEYGGGDWDQQMGKGADYNFLIQFGKLTGFRIARDTESIPVRKLRLFPKHKSPPFVFLTGSGDIQLSSADIKTLRWYCLQEGGMIFADNGGGSFNYHFRRLMQRAFPELEWVDIASDDVIYRHPYVFPRGAPPLWHHSGTRALGLKHHGRWIVFYHQGDLNDAWQTGHSGVSRNSAMQAYRLGVNVVNYAFNQYYEMHYER